MHLSEILARAGCTPDRKFYCAHYRKDMKTEVG